MIETTVTAEDFTITIEEFPEDNYIIGQIEAETNMGSIVFSLEAQNPSGAFVIDEATGELRVNDGSLFNFETNPIITATVKASNAEIFKDATITITVNEPQGSNYHKIIDVDNVWIYRDYFDDGFSSSDSTLRQVYFNGEEIINGETYSNLYNRVLEYRFGSTSFSFENHSVKEETSLYKIREDLEAKKVYTLDANNNEVLLYDFSIEVDDIVDLWDTETNNYITQTVISIENVSLLNGETRKKINFENNYSIIESIGYSHVILRCFFKNNNILLTQLNSCDDSFWDEGGTPVLDLEAIYLVDQTIRSKSSLLGDGGNHIENNIIEKGICWSSASQNPTVDDNFSSNYTNEQPGVNNNEVSDLRRFYTIGYNSNLQPNTTHYFRSYSKNTNGVAYSDTVNTVDTAYLSSILRTLLINREVLSNGDINFYLEGNLTQNNFPTNTTIIEKGFAVFHNYNNVRPQSPFESQLMPVQGGTLNSFERIEMHSPVNKMDYFYRGSYFWVYVKFDNGLIVYGNRIER